MDCSKRHACSHGTDDTNRIIFLTWSVDPIRQQVLPMRGMGIERKRKRRTGRIHQLSTERVG